MNYHGTERIFIYAPAAGDPSALALVGSKLMWTYLSGDDSATRVAGATGATVAPHLLAKFGDDYLPVKRRAGRKYIVASDTPTAARPLTLAEAVAEMVAKGKAAKPELAKRLDDAGQLVTDGRVTLAGDAAAKIGPYNVTADGCDCPDFKHRGGWCKHRLAVRMARHLLASKFDLPRPAAAAPASPISAANRALIASGAVIDAATRERLAYLNSRHGARTAVLRMLGNGVHSLPADLVKRAGGLSQEKER